jgi:glycerol-3-phosphate cytidylyltransferase
VSQDSTPLVGYTTGVFDLFHIGHVNLLRGAAARCDRLVVGVTTDELSLARKGKTPVVPYAERADIVASLRFVSDVVPQTTMNKRQAWDEVRFQRMFVGDDWQGTDSWNAIELDLAPLGVEIVYLPYTAHTSSTILREALTKLA